MGENEWITTQSSFITHNCGVRTRGQQHNNVGERWGTLPGRSESSFGGQSLFHPFTCRSRRFAGQLPVQRRRLRPSRPMLFLLQKGEPGPVLLLLLRRCHHQLPRRPRHHQQERFRRRRQLQDRQRSRRLCRRQLEPEHLGREN